jgi:hypothetical protein
MDDTQIILTTKQVLFNFSISREQLRRWSERGLQKVERGRFDLKTIIRFRDEFIVGFGHNEMEKAKLRREQAKARYQELITLEKEGVLIDRDRVITHNISVIQQAKSQLWGLRRTLPPKLAGKEPREMGAVIKHEVGQILTRLHHGMGKGRRSL